MRVAVEDENDHAPTFGSAHLSLEVPEGQDPQILTTLRASDPDVGANGQLQYRILGENRPTPTNSAPTCPTLLLVGLCQTQVVCLGLLFLLFLSSTFSFMHISMPLQPFISLYFCFYLLFLFFFFLVSPYRAVVLKFIGLKNS